MTERAGRFRLQTVGAERLMLRISRMMFSEQSDLHLRANTPRADSCNTTDWGE